MRISDWSSDVCSSDLQCQRSRGRVERLLLQKMQIGLRSPGDRQRRDGNPGGPLGVDNGDPGLTIGRSRFAFRSRSEEHTSELQSLMRISYAVFCLKKKKQNRTQKIVSS